MGWQLRLGAVLLLVAAAVDTVHYLIFRDSDYIFKFILAQLGFLPVSVFLVTVVVNQLLGRREKTLLLNKLNMVIGSFFSEVGTDLLRLFPRADGDGKGSPSLLVSQNWQSGEYVAARNKKSELAVSAEDIDWQKLKKILAEKKGFLLTLLANPNLLEHETFTDLLWAVFHLAEEVGCRRRIDSLPPSDYEHLVGDVNRAYRLLLGEWLSYMEHLQADYPYLFSLAIRTNPFDPDASPEIS